MAISGSAFLSLSTASQMVQQEPQQAVVAPKNSSIPNVNSEQSQISLGKTFFEVLQAKTQDWEKSQQKQSQLLQKIPAEHRSIFELQSKMNQLHIQTEVLARVGEALSSSLKRVQQMSGS